MRRWLVAYDISNDRNRDRAATVLLSRGVRLQYSVYEVDDHDVDALVTELEPLLEELTDRVLITPVCGSCREGQRHLGQTGPRLHEPWWIV